jgi:hypothetical protein
VAVRTLLLVLELVGLEHLGKVLREELVLAVQLGRRQVAAGLQP